MSNPVHEKLKKATEHRVHLHKAVTEHAKKLAAEREASRQSQPPQSPQPSSQD